jgi:hypothetical protein
MLAGLQQKYRAVYKLKAIPHNSKCRYGERGAAAAKPKAQIILDAAKVSAASGGNSEPKQGRRWGRGRDEKLEIRNEKLGILGEGAGCEVCAEQ